MNPKLIPLVVLSIALPISSARATDPPAPATWHGSISANLTQIQSSANTSAFNVFASAKRETPQRSTVLDQTFISSRQKALGATSYTTTEEAWFGNGNHTYKIGEKLSGFFNARLQTDRIQNLKLRSILGGGVSYVFIKRTGLTIKGSGGLAWLRDSFTTGSSTSSLSGQFGYGLEKALGAKTRFTHDFTIYPKLSDTKNYYYLTQFSLEQTVAGNFFFSVRYILEHTTTPAPTASSDTKRFLFGVGSKF